MEKAGISKVEQFAINKVRELRKQREISQAKLAYSIDVSPTFIGDVENPKKPQKYNLAHLNEIAKVLDCDLWDIIPKKPIE